ncbi:MAG: OB-fold domain-containing protein [Acidobacteria bacterium]|nr:OB-fold domain-containing protein [Acidobacteriota bacterium]
MTTQQTTPAPVRPLPLLDRDNKEWWQACKRHELFLQRCADCKTLRHPPRPMCSNCQSLNSEWIKSGGTGSVYSYVIIRQPAHPFFADKVPYGVVLVELKEGPRVIGSMADGSLDIEVGMPVKVDFEDVSEDIALLVFRRAE